MLAKLTVFLALLVFYMTIAAVIREPSAADREGEQRVTVAMGTPVPTAISDPSRLLPFCPLSSPNPSLPSFLIHR